MPSPLLQADGRERCELATRSCGSLVGEEGEAVKEERTEDGDGRKTEMKEPSRVGALDEEDKVAW